MSSGTFALMTPSDLGLPVLPAPSGATVKLHVRPPDGSFEYPWDDGCARESWQRESAWAVSAETLTSGDYVTTLKRIEEFRAEEDEDDRPSDYACQKARELLRQAAKELRFDFRRARVSVGPGRSLRLTWSSRDREARLICGGGPANKTYIYSESPAGHTVDYIVDGARLARYLCWVLQEP